MRTYYLFFIIVLTVSFLSCQPDYPSAFVNASNGLNLRDQPNSNGSKIFLLPFRSEVKILEQSSDVVTVGGIKGSWTKVKYQDKIGWVFNPYLSDSKDFKIIFIILNELSNHLLTLDDKTIDLSQDLIVRRLPVIDNATGSISDKDIHYPSYDGFAKLFGYKEATGGTVRGPIIQYNTFRILTENYDRYSNPVLSCFLSMTEDVTLDDFIAEFGYPNMILINRECCYDSTGAGYKIGDYALTVKSPAFRDAPFKETTEITDKKVIDGFKTAKITEIEISLGINKDK